MAWLWENFRLMRFISSVMPSWVLYFLPSFVSVKVHISSAIVDCLQSPQKATFYDMTQKVLIAVNGGSKGPSDCLPW